MRKYLIFFVIATFSHTVVSHIDPAIPCRNDEHCIEILNIHNAFCRGGLCLCKTGSNIKNCSSLIMHTQNRIVGSPGFHPCKTNQDCLFHNGFCNTTNSACECQKDYVMSGNRTACLKKADKIDFPCAEDKQCFTFPNTTCANGQCTCIPGFHYTDGFCHRSAEFGKTCTQSQQCSLVDGAVCNEARLCGCPAETLISADAKKCLPVAREIAAECAEDVQCNMTFADSMCIDKTCQCRYSYHFESDLNRCYLNRALDEDCAINQECYQEPNENERVSMKAVRCSQNICVCADNFFREGNRCANAANSIGSSLLYLALPTIVHFASSWKL